MPRTKSSTVQNKFINGLKTDFTGLNFPEDACTSCDNVIFEKEGRITRRKGFDFEDNFSARTVPKVTLDAYSTYQWSAIADTSQRNFIVEQSGNTLLFYKVSDDTNVTNTLAGLSLSLLDFRPAGSTEVPGNFVCDYVTTSGDLVVVNPKIDSIIIKYDVSSDTFTTEVIDIRVRDFNGIEDNDVDPSFRPSSTYADYSLVNPEFIYNLVNNGWSKDLLDEWDAARPDLPSLRDFVGLYAGVDPDKFDPSLVTDVPPTTEQVGGHFVLDAFKPNRTDALVSETNLTGIVLEETLVGTAEGTIFGNADTVDVTRKDSLFDGNNLQDLSNSTIITGGPVWFGKDYSSTSSKSLSSIVLTSPSDAPFSSSGAVTFQVYTKTGTTFPTSSTDGTLLDTFVSGTGNAETLTFTNTATTPATFVWVRIATSGTYNVADITINERVFTDIDLSSVTPTFPSVNSTPSSSGVATDLKVDDESSLLTFRDVKFAEITADISPTSPQTIAITPPDNGFTGSSDDTVTVRVVSFDDNTTSNIEVFSTIVSGDSSTVIDVPDFASLGTFSTTYNLRLTVDSIVPTLSIRYVEQTDTSTATEDQASNSFTVGTPTTSASGTENGPTDFEGFLMSQPVSPGNAIFTDVVVTNPSLANTTKILSYFRKSSEPTTITGGTLAGQRFITFDGTGTVTLQLGVFLPSGVTHLWIEIQDSTTFITDTVDVQYSTIEYSTTGIVTVVSPTITTPLQDPIDNDDVLFDNVQSKIRNLSTVYNTVTTAFVGKDLGAGNELALNNLVIEPASDTPLPSTGTFKLMASLSAPASATDGDVLSTVASAGQSTDVSLPSNDIITEYRYIWLSYTGGTGLEDLAISTITFQDSNTEQISTIDGVAIAVDSDVVGAGVEAIYDSVTDTDTPSSGSFTNQTESYTGKTLSGPTTVSRIVVFLPSDYSLPTGQYTASLYGKTTTGTPSDASDGTVLGTTAVSGGTTSSFSVTSTDTTTLYRHLWLKFVRQDGASISFNVAELQLYVLSTSGTTVNVDLSEVFSRPSVTALFSNRICYAGVGSGVISSNIYISGVLRDNRDIGRCFQVNDPTSTDNGQLLASDGIVVRIPEMVRVQKLVPQNNDLIVIASNGVWVVAGVAGSSFAADNFRITKVSPVRCESGEGVVIVEDSPMWWGEDSIYSLTYNVQFQSYDIKSVSEGSIENFLNAVPEVNKRYVKGAYDYKDKVVRWTYNSDLSLNEEDYYSYNAELVYNTITKSFYPTSVSNDNVDIRGILYVQSGDRLSRDIMKYHTTIEVGNSVGHLSTWADRETSTDYSDWGSYNSGQYATDYVSTFTTGYLIHGEAQRFVQPNWLFLHMDYSPDASAKVQGIWDWSNHGDSGKWSSKQEAYFTGKTNRDVLSRRLKIRGKGRSLQWKVTSTTGKPFAIIGWSVRESGNNEV